MCTYIVQFRVYTIPFRISHTTMVDIYVFFLLCLVVTKAEPKNIQKYYEYQIDTHCGGISLVRLHKLRGRARLEDSPNASG